MNKNEMEKLDSLVRSGLSATMLKQRQKQLGVKPKIGRPGGSRRKLMVIAELTRDPNQIYGVVAQKCGITATRVGQIAKECGL